MIDDGGQAFPRNYAYQNPNSGLSELKSLEGMSLRDWFAGQAMIGLISNCNLEDGWPVPQKQAMASYAYQYADFMIKERNKGA